jgi:hypoxanthine phosphoribosyltransferase
MDLLVIDDVTDTGETLSTAVSYLQEQNPFRIRTAVLHHKISSGFTPDYYAELVKDWRWIIYPWAVHEDISGFLELELTDQPVTLPELRDLLQKRYGMPVTSQDLLKAADDLIRMQRAVKEGDSYRKAAPATSGENS